MNFWTYLVNDRLFSEFLAAFHGFSDMCLCAELGNYVPLMYSVTLVSNLARQVLQ
jgi:hypothetical protein